MIEILIDVLAAVGAAARRRRLHRPGVLHPAALVDVVNQEVAVAAAAGPQERVEALHLVEQLADAGRLGGRGFHGGAARHAIGPEQNQVAELA